MPISMSAILAALLGLTCAGAVLVCVDGLRRRPRLYGDLRARTARLDKAAQLRIAAGVVAGLLVEVTLGWPVAAVLVAFGVLALPPILGSRRASRRQEARLEAVATWAEMLRDNLRSAAGLEQAVVSSAQSPPAAIAAEIGRLADDLARRVPIAVALRRFAADLADPIADLVIGQLTLAATAQAGQLGDTLSVVAAQARERVAMRLDIEADRAGIRTQIRMVVVTTVLLAVGLVVFRRPFLRPYESMAGELVVAVIGTFWLAGFALLARQSRFTDAPRMFASVPKGGDRP
jgi:tight adherence protein B